MADSTVVVLVPESGDGIQTLKSGVMEIADLFVVNKADRPGAEKLQSEIEITLGIRKGNAFRRIKGHHGVSLKRSGVPEALVKPEPAGWEPPVLLASAARSEGIDAVLTAVTAHLAAIEVTGELAERRRRRLALRTREVVNRAVERWVWREAATEALIADRIDAMVEGRTSPYEVAAEVVAGLKEGVLR